MSRLTNFLAHFGAVAHADASHFAKVVKADWDALIADLADLAPSDEKTHVETTLAASTVTHNAATGTADVQLPAGGLAVLHEIDTNGAGAIVSTANGLRVAPPVAADPVTGEESAAPPAPPAPPAEHDPIV